VLVACRALGRQPLQNRQAAFTAQRFAITNRRTYTTYQVHTISPVPPSPDTTNPFDLRFGGTTLLTSYMNDDNTPKNVDPRRVGPHQHF